MQRPIHRLGILVIILFASLILTNCSGSGSGSAPPPPPPPPPPITPTGVPYPPASVIATAISDTQINIGWSSVSDATSYNVYRSEQTGTAYTYTVVSGTTATIVSDTTVTSGTAYYYVVSGTNSLGEGPLSAEVGSTPALPSGTLTITGTIKYEDKEYDQSVGHTGNTSLKTVRFAEVELVNASSSVTLWSTRTNSNGVYSISTSTNTGTKVYVRVLSSAAPVGVNTVSVMDLSPAFYAVKTTDFTLNGETTVNLTIPTTNTADGAFNILDVLTSGYKFVETYAAMSTPDLNAYWQPNSSYGTYYCDGPDSIYCIRGAGIYVYSNYDTDEFDDDVLWHEFGHFIADKFSNDASPGGFHSLDDNTQDLRLSWSEGWGNFFPTAVKYWLNATDTALLSANPSITPLSQYVDTETGGLYLTVDIGAPETDACIDDNCKYASNEIANANVLWNTMNASQLSMDKIWEVFDNYLPTLGSSYPVNIENFWDGWLANYPTDSTALHTVFNDRLIDYSADGYETDNTPVTAQSFTLGSGQPHRIYGDGDTDYVMFSVLTTTAQYTIRTSSLRNGADTYLTLFGDTGTNFIASNDNATQQPTLPPNNTTALSSLIVRNLGPGDYYVSVNSSPVKPASAGRYGSYMLTITSP